MPPGFSVTKKGNLIMKSVANTKEMTLMGLMTAIICIIAPFSIVLPFSPIPLSMGTLAIYFCVIILGMKRGIICVSIYLLLGLVGLPVFSGFTGGIGKLFGPTGGYMIGYLFLALICGIFVDKFSNKLILCTFGMLLGTFVCYLFGTLWLAYQASLSFSQALFSAVIPFLPGDILKLIIAMLIGFQIRRRLKIC